MDQLIISNTEEARIHVSYTSLNNPRDQYHRNANLPVQSNDLIKLPIFLFALEQLELGFLDIDEAFKVRSERLLVNNQGMFGADDAGRFTTTAELLQAISQYSDNAACNILLNRLDKETFSQRLQKEKLNSIYLLKDLDDRTKHQTLNAGNFIATGDMVNFQKKVIQEMANSRKGKALLKDFLLSENTDASIKTKEDAPLITWQEDTQLCKGMNAIVYGENGFILTILISNFKNENYAAQLLEKAERIYFSNFEKLSLN